jgi:3-phosphoshikimate 1-carboxyvinyltransferase
MSPELPQLQLPGCKSVSQRALLLAALAEGSSRLTGVSPCEDSTHLRAALAKLGAAFEDVEVGVMEVQGMAGPPQGEVALDVGEAGSSLRFLLPVCAAGKGRFTITGTPRLMSRPHDALVEVLRELGARVETTEHAGRPGFLVESDGLPSGRWPVPQATSSQYLTGLSLAASLIGDVELDVPSDLPSRGYFDLTLDALRAFARTPDGLVEEALPGGASRLRFVDAAPVGRGFAVPGDPSGATFLLVALIVTGRAARITPDWSARHPEAQLLVELLEAGLIERSGTDWHATGFQPSAPLELTLDPAPDAGPGLAVLGSALPHGIVLHGVERLRAKESDRVQGVQRLAALVGRTAQLEGDSLVLTGGGIDAAAARETPPFDPDQDHRLAMAAGVARLVARDIRIDDPGCVAKSFPDFWTEIAKLAVEL